MLVLKQFNIKSNQCNKKVEISRIILYLQTIKGEMAEW